MLRAIAITGRFLLNQVASDFTVDRYCGEPKRRNSFQHTDIVSFFFPIKTMKHPVS